MRAVITVVGKDAVGILANVSTKCASYNVNVNEVSQTILEDMFCMIMLCDISNISIDFGDFSDEMAKLGEGLGLSIHAMHEKIFNSMHKI